MANDAGSAQGAGKVGVRCGLGVRGGVIGVSLGAGVVSRGSMGVAEHTCEPETTPVDVISPPHHGH